MKTKKAKPTAILPRPPRRGNAPTVSAPGPMTVLLAVTGMSPAVLTETVWALAHETPPIIPDRVVVVTTVSGRQCLERELLTPSVAGTPDVWQELRTAVLGQEARADQRLILEPVRLVEAPNPGTGRMDWLEDLRTPAENAATANFLLGELRRWTESPDTRLVVSIAGGRKTMGALLYACVSLIGRETDRLTHVLVREPFDDPRLKPRFYFPEQPLRDLRAHDGTVAKAGEALIELADIPFVPLRNLFERDLIRKPSTFMDLVTRCRAEVRDIVRRQVKVQVRYNRREVLVGDQIVKLSPKQMLLLLFLAENVVKKLPPPDKQENAVEPLRAFAQRLRHLCVPEDGNDWRDEAMLPGDFGGQELRKVLNELKQKFRAAGLPASDIVRLLPAGTRFTLDLDPKCIRLT